MYRAANAGSFEPMPVIAIRYGEKTQRFMLPPASLADEINFKVISLHVSSRH